ncbi:MAG: site-specific integrase [Lentisphaeria bacterium]|nr:site-specific integrase [Lentisphaeria bacterium]
MTKKMSEDTQYWYQRTIDQIILTGKSDNTAKTYSRDIRILGRYIDKPLAELTEEDIRKFVLYRRNECKLGDSSMRVLICGLRTLYQDLLGKEWPLLKVLKSKRERRLPIVISREDVRAILEHAYMPQHKAYLRVVYSCGLRRNEALDLTVNDIDGKRHLLHIHGKGARDRYVPLPEKTYQCLRDYWSTHRNSLYIFPALSRSNKCAPTAKKPMSTSSVQVGLKKAIKRAGIQRDGIHMHTLRHSYATHLLENGLSIKVVQEYLGHASLQHTINYLHLTNWGKEDAYVKIDQMMGEI